MSASEGLSSIRNVVHQANPSLLYHSEGIVWVTNNLQKTLPRLAQAPAWFSCGVLRVPGGGWEGHGKGSTRRSGQGDRGRSYLPLLFGLFLSVLLGGQIS